MTYYNLVEVARKRYPAVVQDLELSGKFDTDESILENIELYQLMTRNELLLQLSSKDEPYTECTECITPKELLDRQKILDENHLMVYRFSKDASELIFVCNKFDTRKPSFTINFNEYKTLKLLYITPLNYKLLEQGRDVIFSMLDPVIYYKRILYDAIEHRASDVHLRCNMTREQTEFSVMDPNYYNNLVDKDGNLIEAKTNGLFYEYKVFYRVLNNLEFQPKFRFNKDIYESIISKIVSEETNGTAIDLDTFYGVQTSWLNPFYDGYCNLRIRTQRCTGGHILVTRIQPITVTSMKIDDLGFDDKTTECIRDLSTYTSGVLFVTGPVRSGKNTTINAIVNELVDKKLCISEYSSPIEIINPFSQIDYEANETALMGCMDAIKKQDVDIAILNEIPKKEIAPAIVDLINSSVSVITTFHLTRIWHLPYKLQNYFGDDYKTIITSINGVINQKMLINQCYQCRVQTGNIDRLTSYQKKLMKKYNISSYYYSEGCSKCKGTGLANSVQPYAEYLIFDENLKSQLLKCDEPYQMSEIIKDRVRANQTALEDSVAKGIKKGDLTPDAFNVLR